MHSSCDPLKISCTMKTSDPAFLATLKALINHDQVDPISGT